MNQYLGHGGKSTLVFNKQKKIIFLGFYKSTGVQVLLDIYCWWYSRFVSKE